jgi:hypothetical protein
MSGSVSPRIELRRDAARIWPSTAPAAHQPETHQGNRDHRDRGRLWNGRQLHLIERRDLTAGQGIVPDGDIADQSTEKTLVGSADIDTADDEVSARSYRPTGDGTWNTPST